MMSLGPKLPNSMVSPIPTNRPVRKAVVAEAAIATRHRRTVLGIVNDPSESQNK
jgi:hypothetical protein